MLDLAFLLQRRLRPASFAETPATLMRCCCGSAASLPSSSNCCCRSADPHDIDVLLLRISRVSAVVVARLL
jgi:hypothetical protein